MNPPYYPRLPLCNRDLTLTHAYAIASMLDAYTTWLNAWLETWDPPSKHRYTPTQFLDSDPNKSLYGYVGIDAIYQNNNFIVYALTISDGDDGGDTGLTGWLDQYPVWEDNKIVARHTELQHTTQEFETLLTIAMQEGTLTFHGQDHPSKT